MPIRATADVGPLIDALGAADAARRDAAVARLRILGARALGRLTEAYDTTPDRTIRVGILRVVEPLADERALALARRAAAEGGDVAVGGVSVLAEIVRAGSAAGHAAALDLLLSLMEDETVDRRVRAAAVSALDRAPDDIRRAVDALPPIAVEDALWDDAMAGRLPDDPAALREAVPGRAATAPLATLRRLVEAVKEREDAGPGDWRAVRGALHQALALRGSRIALYDLREAFERASSPLPSSFLAAVQVIGDASCLEPIAGAFARSAAEPRWQRQLADAFHAVARRERLTSRHAAMRRALAKAPALASL